MLISPCLTLYASVTTLVSASPRADPTLFYPLRAEALLPLHGRHEFQKLGQGCHVRRPAYFSEQARLPGLLS